MKKRKKSPKVLRDSNTELDENQANAIETEAEGEDDLVAVDPARSHAVVTSTDWTTETIIRQFERKTIELDPSFQRRDTWSPVRKSKFIESLMMGLPIPQIVLAEKKEKPGSFIVIDGKQRLLALQQFAGTANGVGDAPRLTLTGLPSLEALNDKTYKQLEENPIYADHLDAFRNQPIRSVVVKSWPDENFLYLVFLRLNTGSVALAPQELRQALHPGPFLAFANERSAESTPIQACLRITKPDFRMRDVELMIRFYAFKEYMPSYRGTMKGFLDDACQNLNERWIAQSAEPTIRGLADELDKSILESRKVFPDGALFSIWLNSAYEGRFNRTVFDIFTFYLSNPKVRKAVAGKHVRLRKMFEKLCANDEDFRQSLQVTTKSLRAVHTRFSHFGEALARLVKMKLPIPKLIENRLVIN